MKNIMIQTNIISSVKIAIYLLSLKSIRKARIVFIPFIVLSIASLQIIYSTTAYAASCGGQETSLISCDDTTNGIWNVLLIFISFLTGGVAIFAVGGFIYAAILYTSAADSNEQVTKAKSIIKNIIIGLICFAFMFATLQFLIPGGINNGVLTPPKLVKIDEKSTEATYDSHAKSIEATHLHSSGRYDRSTKQWKSDLESLRIQFSPTIITLTEASGRTDAVEWPGWSHSNGESIVAWKDSDWKKVSSELVELAPNVPYFRNIVVSVVVLEHRKTKTTWLWTSSHIPSSVDAGNGNFGNEADRVAKWKASMNSLSTIVNDTMSKHDIKRRHSVITADWNVNLAQSAWREMMAKYFPNRIPSNSVGSAGTHGNRTIDSSLVSDDLNVITWRSLGTIPSSDHKPFLAKYKAEK